MHIHHSILELIGHTPLLELKKIESTLALKAQIIAKLEAFNPGGSIKDRVAYAMLKAALDSGKITHYTEIIEPTSGNTGIGLALVGAALGLKVTIIMPDSMSEERRNTIAAYGAKLVLTPGKLGMQGTLDKAYELQKLNPNSFIPQQFENPANPEIHFATTGPEIYADTEGKVDLLVGGVGTGGTICGAGRYLKSRNSSVKVIAVEPASSPLLSEGKAGPHKIQGIGANFIPKNYDAGVVDKVVTVSNEDAFSTGRLVARTEGVFLGISAGAALHAAITLARLPEHEGRRIVVILPDSGDRYLSTPLYREEA
ncbi:MAG: cysteine synthase A [Succinivibrio sp.]|nr:cysteine synthase A [Succinivibrio sp.]